DEQDKRGRLRNFVGQLLLPEAAGTHALGRKENVRVRVPALQRGLQRLHQHKILRSSRQDAWSHRAAYAARPCRRGDRIISLRAACCCDCSRPVMALSVISLLRSDSVAFGCERTCGRLTEATTATTDSAAEGRVSRWHPQLGDGTRRQ